MNNEPSVLITFLGNINYDSRSLNLYNSFKQKNHQVRFVGFDWLTDNFKTVKGEITVFKLTKGVVSLFYYIKFSCLLINSLLKNKYEICFAEDIYTLPFVCMIAKRKNVKVFYDSRELFGHLAGLRNKKGVQSILRFIEKKYIKKADCVITTGRMDSEFLIKEYKINNTFVLRNLPYYNKRKNPIDLKKQFNIPANKFLLLYQGVVLHGRGLRLIFDVMKDIIDYELIIIGGGENLNDYKKLVEQNDISSRVHFIGKVDQSKLPDYTSGADAGLALIENISLSYYYALPNKLFEYIMAEIPVIASNLPQMKEIVEKYKVGVSVNPYEKNEIKLNLEKLYTNKEYYKELKSNCISASKELNWEKEFDYFYVKYFNS